MTSPTYTLSEVLQNHRKAQQELRDVQKRIEALIARVQKELDR